MQDEARHVAFGRLALRDYYPQLPTRSGASARISSSKAPTTCATGSTRPKCGSGRASDVPEVMKTLDDSEGQVRFRKRLFSRIVPDRARHRPVERARAEGLRRPGRHPVRRHRRAGDARQRRQGGRGFDRRMQDGFGKTGTDHVFPKSTPETRNNRPKRGCPVFMIDTTPHVITSLLAMGMALAFIIADRNSPTSRALALFLMSIGVSIGIGSQIAYPLHYAGHLLLVGRRVRDSRGDGVLLRLRVDPARAPHGAGRGPEDQRVRTRCCASRRGWSCSTCLRVRLSADACREIPRRRVSRGVHGGEAGVLAVRAAADDLARCCRCSPAC